MSITDFAAITIIMPWIMVAGTVVMCWAQSTGILMAQLLGAGTAARTLDASLSRAWRSAIVSAI